MQTLSSRQRSAHESSQLADVRIDTSYGRGEVVIELLFEVLWNPVLAEQLRVFHVALDRQECQLTQCGYLFDHSDHVDRVRARDKHSLVVMAPGECCQLFLDFALFRLVCIRRSGRFVSLLDQIAYNTVVTSQFAFILECFFLFAY